MISAPSLSTWMEMGRLVGDHIWQSTLFAGVVGLLTLAFRNHRAQVRNSLWLAASVKFLIPFAVLVALGGHFGWRRAAPLAQNPAPFVIDMDTMSQPFARLAAGAPPAAVSHGMASAIPIVLCAIWLCGCGAILLTWWTRWRRVAATIREASPVHQGPELDTLRRLEAIAGITKPVALVSSNTSLEPGVFGIVRPVLLWPRSIAGHLADKHVEMILAHELSHVRRRDNLAAAIHMLVETLFWFHPLVWWLGARMVDERERACDEDVLRLGGKPQVYAESVLKVCEFYLESPIACVAGVTGSNLKKRMERIMSNHVGETLNIWRKLILATTAVAALAAPVVAGVLTAPRLRAQSPAGQTQAGAADRAKFEVASIKPVKPGNPSPTMGGPHPRGLFTAPDATIRGLIRLAYQMEGHQLVAAPEWDRLLSEHFEIEAKAQGNPTHEQTWLMMQSLLTDRFKLIVHHETRQLPVYVLAVDKTGKMGPQLKPHSDSAKCIDPTGPPPPPDRLVLDRTGLNGVFDFTLESSAAIQQGRAVFTAPTSDPSEPPSIFTALQEQLGLTLEATTGPVDVLVIDHVEEPSPN